MPFLICICPRSAGGGHRFAMGRELPDGHGNLPATGEADRDVAWAGGSFLNDLQQKNRVAFDIVGASGDLQMNRARECSRRKVNYGGWLRWRSLQARRGCPNMGDAKYARQLTSGSIVVGIRVSESSWKIVMARRTARYCHLGDTALAQ